MTAPEPFIGRKEELDKLNRLINLNRSSLVVLNGRRRIGKSRLAEEFAKDKTFLKFLGAPPTVKTTEQSQRTRFSKKLAKYCKQSPQLFKDWEDAFEALSEYILSMDPSEQVVVLFDEISWIGSLDHMFIPLFKSWWDSWDAIARPHPNFVLILCGSISTWIEKNIINNTGLYGRFRMRWTLTDLSLPEAHQLLLARGVQLSTIDIVKILSITGGVPWYLQQIEPGLSADENIKELCFTRNGLFVEEYHKIFHDLFQEEGPFHKAILERLVKGMCDIDELKRHFVGAGLPAGPEQDKVFNNCLHNLRIAGFVTRHYNWSLKTGKDNNLDIYSLSDNYMRFYLKYIDPHLKEIEGHAYQDATLSQLPFWRTMVGFQVENLLIKNRHALITALGLSRADIVHDNPYIQRPTKEHPGEHSVATKGCQIDFLVQTISNNLYVCEFKFCKNELGFEAIQSVKDKISRFVVPEGFGVLRVLVHASGVSKAVRDSGYFHRIINIAEFL